jgi:BirA family biotin operon repressor/biotin-[acetyl-CoA-carboxylase] ligase
MQTNIIDTNTQLINNEIFHFSEIDSTNLYLLKNDLENGTVAMADFQTSGRGRMTRKWEAPKDDALLFSLLLTENLEQFHPAAFTFLTAIAVLEGLKKVYYDLPAILKWPNDILVDSKKISGILVESRSLGNKLSKVVIGVGININQDTAFFDNDALKHGTSLKLVTGQVGNRIFILENILESLEENLFFAKGSDVSLVLKKWKNYCPYIGKPLTIISKGKNYHGVFSDMDHDGGLVLDINGKKHTFYAGDVTIDKDSL